jgi:TonB-linked SusC/RagA family outer membrane protein
MKNMNMKKYIYQALLLLTIGLMLPSTVTAQNKGGNRRGKGKAVTQQKKESGTVKVTSQVVDANGEPIANALVSSGEGAYIIYTDAEGRFTLSVARKNDVVVEALGYQAAFINVSAGKFPQHITLQKAALYASDNDRFSRADGGATYQRDMVGAADKISGDALTTFPDLLLSNALQGRIAGLQAIATIGGLRNNGSTLYLRGQHSTDAGAALVIVDGAERSLADLMAEEIETIEFLKDPTTKVLYGPRAVNGVINITTKRGQANRRTVKVSLSAGVTLATKLASFLDSYQYANLYNEARRNDGLPDYYSAAQLEGYKNSTGAYDMRYPDVDYYKEFLKSSTFYRKATVDVNGGSRNVQYLLNVGYTGNGGYEKVGKAADYNQLNLRGNLDVRVTDYLVVRAGIAGQVLLRNWGSMDGGSVMGAVSGHRPNSYPLTLDPTLIGLPVDSAGMPTFGGSITNVNNLYAGMKYGGFTSERYLNNQANVKFDFDFAKYVPGLKAAAYLTFDSYSYFKNGQSNTYPTYAIDPYLDEAGEQAYRITQLRKIALQTDQSRLDQSFSRRSSWGLNANYNTRIGRHDWDAALAYAYFKREVEGASQHVITANYTARLNYGYDHRYLAELDLAYMGSNRFRNGGKFFLSPAVGAAWVLSNEAFLKDNPLVNFLKLKGSFGIVGTDIGASALIYNTAWSTDGTIAFGERNASSTNKAVFTRMGVDDIRWERSTEYNIGIEALLLQNRLSAAFNYFNETRSDIVLRNTPSFTNIVGAFAGSGNYGEVRNHGVEATLHWRDNVGDFGYDFGLNLAYTQNKLLKWNEMAYPDENIRTVGHPTDIIQGYVAEGLFGKEVPLAGHVVQTLGTYQEGDIAYADLNRDGLIDERDKTVIGNAFPRMTYGVEVSLRYKQWGFYLLGVAQTGIEKMLTSGYYWNRGEGKYSTLALDRWHPTDNPDGVYPRLTTQPGTNNFRNSSFWVADADFFRLKNVEVSYTLSNKQRKPLFRNMKLFARGTNLFVLSGIKDMDPELVEAGLNNYPIGRTLTAGLSVNF